MSLLLVQIKSVSFLCFVVIGRNCLFTLRQCLDLAARSIAMDNYAEVWQFIYAKDLILEDQNCKNVHCGHIFSVANCGTLEFVHLCDSYGTCWVSFVDLMAPHLP